MKKCRHWWRWRHQHIDGWHCEKCCARWRGGIVVLRPDPTTPGFKSRERKNPRLKKRSW